MSKNIAYFKAPVNSLGRAVFSSPDAPLKTEWTALVATEGSFKDSADVEHTFTPEKLLTIEAHTNEAIDSGVVVPVCADHKKNVDNTIGAVNGRAFTKIITPQDLPNTKSTDLIGKLGLFVSGVKVAAEKGLQSLRCGVKSVSMGLNLDPMENRIMEVSLVPIPAIRGMGLFAKKLAINARVARFGEASNAVTWEELEADDQSLEDLKDGYDDLTEKLWTLLTNAYENENIDIDSPEILMQLIYSELNGFSVRILSLLGLDAAIQEPNAIGRATPSPMDGQNGMNAVADGGKSIEQLQQATYYRKTKTANFKLANKYYNASN